MTQHLGSFVVRRRRLVLLVAGGVLAVMAVLATQAFGVLKGGGFADPDSGSSRAEKVIDNSFGGQTNLVLLVGPRDGGSVDSAAVTSVAHRVVAHLAARRDVESVTSYWDGHAPQLRAADGRSGLITMYVSGDDKAQGDAARAIISAATKQGDDAASVRVRAGGDLAANQDIADSIAVSLGRAEAVAVPVTLLLLVLAFGSLLAAVLPLIIGLFAVGGTFAELAVLGRLTDVSIYAVNLTTALGLGLAIDYSLLMVNRFREQLRRGDNIEDAVTTTIRTAGRTIIFSSATVAAALAALLVFPVYFLRSFAYAGIGVVVIALLASLIVLPALLALFGTKVAHNRRARADKDESVFWRRTAVTVMRRPLVVGGVVIAALLVLGVPFLHVNFGSPDDRVLHTSAGSRQVGDVLRAEYSSAASSPVDVVIQGRASRAGIEDFQARMGQLPHASAVQPIATRATATYLQVVGPSDTNSGVAQNLVREIRAVEPPPHTRVLVGGASATLVDGNAAIGGNLPWALLWIVATTLVLLFLFTGSVVLPVKALLLNALSLTAVFGALVWIFQDGHLSGLLDFTPTPTNTSMLLLIFCIAFGLSMDYEVFLLARIKEAHDHGADTTEAVATGLARTGRIVTTAAALLAVTFFAFGTASVSFIQLFGIGTGIAIVVDATVVRGLLVPAFMRLAGHLNWWAPAPLRRLHQRIGLAETTTEPAPVAAIARVRAPARMPGIVATAQVDRND